MTDLSTLERVEKKQLLNNQAPVGLYAPIPVHAPRSVPLVVIGVMDYPIYDRQHMLRDVHEQSAPWQFFGFQVDATAGANPHRGMPRPAQAVHVPLEPCPLHLDAVSGTRLSARTSGQALGAAPFGEGIVDRLVGLLRGNRH